MLRFVATNAVKTNSNVQIMLFLEDTAQRYPQIASTRFLGDTVEGQPIQMIKVIEPFRIPSLSLQCLQIGAKRTTDSKPAILIEGGIHAREWISPATVQYFIYQLTRKYGA